jgi:hypothetical protein
VLPARIRPRERLLLIAFTPPGTRGAYAERGPVFIHAEPCSGYPNPRPVPARLEPPPAGRPRPLSARPISAGILVNDGEHAMTVTRGLLARPTVTLLHLRNVCYGCYNLAVRRG